MLRCSCSCCFRPIHTGVLLFILLLAAPGFHYIVSRYTRPSFFFCRQRNVYTTFPIVPRHCLPLKSNSIQATRLEALRSRESSYLTRSRSSSANLISSGYLTQICLSCFQKRDCSTASFAWRFFFFFFFLTTTNVLEKINQRFRSRMGGRYPYLELIST